MTAILCRLGLHDWHWRAALRFRLCWACGSIA